MICVILYFLHFGCKSTISSVLIHLFPFVRLFMFSQVILTDESFVAYRTFKRFFITMTVFVSFKIGFVNELFITVNIHAFKFLLLFMFFLMLVAVDFSVKFFAARRASKCFFAAVLTVDVLRKIALTLNFLAALWALNRFVVFFRDFFSWKNKVHNLLLLTLLILGSTFSATSTFFLERQIEIRIVQNLNIVVISVHKALTILRRLDYC